MSTQMFARRRAQVSVGSNTDSVLVGISLPGECRINNININVHLEAGSYAVNTACYYAIEGWILPVPDPEQAIPFDTLWDTLVPKDTDVQTLDLDTEQLDATPFNEPGEVDWSAITNVGLRPERIYERHRFLTFGSVPTGMTIDSANTVLYRPTDTFRIKIGKRYAVANPSVVLFAISSPLLNDVTATKESSLAENEWHRVKYVDHILEQGMSQLLGLVETGAETPWIDAVTLLQKHLEPDVYEEDSGSFQTGNMFAVADAIFDHSVPGRMAKTAISSGR